MSRFLRFAAVCAALFIIPLTVNSQQPPQGGGGGRGVGRGFGGGQEGGGRGFGGGGPDGGGRSGFGGRGMMGGDPMQFFDMIAKGKDVIRRDDLDPMFQRMFDRMAQAQGITNGQITRDQFRTASESFRNRMRGGPDGGGGPQTVTTTTTTTTAGEQGGGPGQWTLEQIDRNAEESFRKHDKKGDGQLQFNEAPDNLKAAWNNYDANKDGTINLEEYKAYYRDRINERMQERGGRGGPGQPTTPEGSPPAPDNAQVQDEEHRPIVYRAGKLPKEIPAWFTELDADKDGQVGLYEWVKAGRSVDLFKAMDRNDDGLLTVEEVLSYVRANKGADSTAVASAAGDDRGRMVFIQGGEAATNGFGGRSPRGGSGGESGGGMGPGRGGRGGFGGFGGGGFGGFGRDRRGGGENASDPRGGNSDRPDHSTEGGGRDRRGRGGRGGEAPSNAPADSTKPPKDKGK
jgi:hypothetical protein